MKNLDQTYSQALQERNLLTQLTNLKEICSSSGHPFSFQGLATILRSLLIHNELKKISDALKPGWRIEAPTYIHPTKTESGEAFLNWNAHCKINIKTSDNADIKFETAGLSIFTANGPRNKKDNSTPEEITKRSPVKLSKFLRFPSFHHADQDISREQVIKFYANNFGVAHFDRKKVESDRIFAGLATRCGISISDGKISFESDFHNGGLSNIFLGNPDFFDIMLLDVISTANYISESPDINFLIEELKLKFGWN